MSRDARELVLAAAPWLADPGLGTFVVGSAALADACRRQGVPGPVTADVDLAWLPAPDAASALLQTRGALIPTTDGNLQRGTVAARIGGRRVEITMLRGGTPGMSTAQRIEADLRARDMTIGAVAIELATGAVHDPLQGLEHWRQRRIVPVGDAAERVREHPVRWLRYYRKAHEHGFALDAAIRRLALPASVLDTLPTEAVALELRAMLLRCASPGRCLMDLFEAGLLQHLAPELARQFDGRSAGPQRWHPELSQALHLILSLEWAVQQSAALDERDRITVLLAVLLHDLGKGFTRAADLPQHPGHEHEGLPHVTKFLDRFPGLADPRARTLCLQVCELHLLVRKLAEVRAGTLATLYDRHFRAKDFPLDLFALAVAADCAGRLDLAGSGDRVRAQVTADVAWLCERGRSVDAGALKQQHPDLERFKAALHEARARAMAAGVPSANAPS